jgi:hypothetical protein
MYLPVQVEFEWMLTENLKANKIGEIIEKAPFIKIPGGYRRSYHPYTKDLILNEVFRRVDPEGRTMCEYFNQVIKPVHDIELYPKISDKDLDKVFTLRNVGVADQLKLYSPENEEYRVVPFDTNETLMAFVAKMMKSRAHLLSNVKDLYKFPFP